MKLSVVLGSHNGAAYIGEQLESILSQTRMPDEIVLSDDASRDDTVAIARDVLSTHPEVQFTVIENVPALGVVRNFEQAALAATGDLNGDGRADLVWRDTAGNPYVWITGENNGIFGGGSTLPLADQGALPNPGAEWAIVAAADLDRDGKADLVFRRASDGANYLWRMNGKAIASQAALPFVGPEWAMAMVGDFDGDGMNDILFRRNDGVNYVWLMNDATIVDQATLPAIDASWTIVKPK